MQFGKLHTSFPTVSELTIQDDHVGTTIKGEVFADPEPFLSAEVNDSIIATGNALSALIIAAGSEAGQGSELEDKKVDGYSPGTPCRSTSDAGGSFAGPAAFPSGRGKGYSSCTAPCSPLGSSAAEVILHGLKLSGNVDTFKRLVEQGSFPPGSGFLDQGSPDLDVVGKNWWDRFHRRFRANIHRSCTWEDVFEQTDAARLRYQRRHLALAGNS